MNGLRPLLLPLVALAAACGARSSLGLPSDDGSGGAGGAPATSSSSSGSSSSSSSSSAGGGPPQLCAALSAQEPFLGLAGGAGIRQRDPALAPAGTDGELVTVVSAWQAVMGPGQLPTELRHTTFGPWDAWPGADIAPSYLADLDAGVSFAAGPADGGRFALLFADFQSPPPGGVRFSDQFIAGEGAVPMSALVDGAAQRAVLVAQRLAGQYLLVTEQRITDPNGEFSRLRLVFATGAGGVTPPADIACASEPLAADAIAMGDSLLLALSNGLEFADPACQGGAPFPASRVQVARIDPGGFEVAADLFTLGVGDVHIEPRSDGAWLVWVEPPGKDLPPRLSLARTDTSGNVVEDVASFLGALPSGAAVGDGPIAAASIEDFLLLAWIAPFGPPGIEVQVFDPDGDPRANLRIDLGEPALGRPVLLAAPSGKSAVLAWTEAPGAQSAGERVRLTRLDCIDK